MKIELLVSRYMRMIGLARYTSCLQKYLSRAGVEYITVEPKYPLILRIGHAILKPFGYDVKTFFNTYPASALLHQDTIKHFTTQMMASLYSFKSDMKPVIITVHDIVPYMMRDHPGQSTYQHYYDRWVDTQAMHNLRKADCLIAISEYTKKMLVEKLDCSPTRIEVVLYGLDHEIFRPLPVEDEFISRYKLNPKVKYLLYVGSENPRKNLSSLVQALPRIKEKVNNVTLLKIGTPEYLENFQHLKNQIHELNLDDMVIFINHPPQEDLIRLYSMADVFVFPSLYEGFGMPPLEAMACGAPVVCSNSTSLPEVVGNAAIMLDPMDISGWADAIGEVLINKTLRNELRKKSLERASEFTWERNVAQTIDIYKKYC